MKLKHIVSTFLLMASLVANSQSFSGAWHGLLNIQGTQLRIVFNITDSITATMDSPDQKAFGIPVTKTEAVDSTLKIEIPQIGLTYTGVLKEDGTVEGTFKQGTLSTSMQLTRQATAAQTRNRPQSPAPPYPYKEERITFRNQKDAITLAGTLTLPRQSTKATAVILISGSGAQNRDQEIAGHKPFLVLADHLTRKGIAVLRYDDRGSYDSQGDFAQATSFDFAQDVRAAVAYLKTRPEIDTTKIGLVGHSEGGMVAPMVAQGDKTISFMVLMAAPAVRGDSILFMQNALIGKAMGLTEQSLATARSINRTIYKMVTDGVSKEEIAEYIKTTAPAMSSSEIDSQLKALLSPWFRTFLSYDPAPTLAKVTCPILALNGTKDLQVPCEVNLGTISTVGNNVTVKRMDGLNHLFQRCETGSPNEYSKIEETISPEIMDAISSWVYSLDIL